MAKNGKVIIGGSFVTLAVMGILGWGDLRTQQKVNTKEIPLKLDKELFQMHQQTQQEQFGRIETDMRGMDKKLDRLLEK